MSSSHAHPATRARPRAMTTSTVDTSNSAPRSPRSPPISPTSSTSKNVFGKVSRFFQRRGSGSAAEERKGELEPNGRPRRRDPVDLEVPRGIRVGSKSSVAGTMGTRESEREVEEDDDDEDEDDQEDQEASRMEEEVRHKARIDDARGLDDAFEKLMNEYALPPHLRPSLVHLTPAHKHILLRSSQSPHLSSKMPTASSAPPRAVTKLRKPSTAGTYPPFPAIISRHPPVSAAHSASKTPGYYAEKLKECGGKEAGFREMEGGLLADLRVLLRNGVSSWTTEFLEAGGYNALFFLLFQIQSLQKRKPGDEKILQLVVRCIKALMTHQLGTQELLTNTHTTHLVRTLLFSSSDLHPPRGGRLQPLELATRALLLDFLCSLAALRTADHRAGYDLLLELLQDTPQDLVAAAIPDTERRTSPAKTGPYPFPMSLKSPPKFVEDAFGGGVVEKPVGPEVEGPRPPRYTTWMRELCYTVDKHIEPITYLAGVLDYRFDSVFKQIRGERLNVSTGGGMVRAEELDDESEEEGTEGEKRRVWKQRARSIGRGKKSGGMRSKRGMKKQRGEAAMIRQEGLVMVDEGVVEYLITHLRLIRTVITTPPTTYRGRYDAYAQEAVRQEFLASGFDKVIKCLLSCPHPTLFSSYIAYLSPLLSPWTPTPDATIALASGSAPRGGPSQPPQPPPKQSSAVVEVFDDVDDDDDDEWEEEEDAEVPEVPELPTRGGSDSGHASEGEEDDEDEEEAVLQLDDVEDAEPSIRIRPAPHVGRREVAREKRGRGKGVGAGRGKGAGKGRARGQA